MSTATKTRLDIVPLTRHIGAEIRGIDLREKPDDETVKAIYQAWLDHLVIVFPGQKLSQEDFIRATGFFGELGETVAGRRNIFPKGYSQLLPGIMMISNIRENGEPIGALPDGEMMFHHDMIHAEVPSKGTLLYSVEIPSTGGNTLFASGYAAYDTLDPAIRNKLEGRRAQAPLQLRRDAVKGDTHGDRGLRRVHPSGVPHPRGHRPQGGLRQPADDGRHRGHAAGGSEPLLDAVFDHAEKPEFVYEHVWRLGDLLLWDNRCSSHARTRFPLDRAAADAAHHGQGQRPAVLRPGTRRRRMEQQP